MSPNLSFPILPQHHRQPSHYEVLGLQASSPGSTRERGPLNQSLVKQAYRAALLRWHPDKSGVGEALWEGQGTGEGARGVEVLEGPRTSNGKGVGKMSKGHVEGFTVDQIRRAYETLIDDRRRKAYEREYLEEIEEDLYHRPGIHPSSKEETASQWIRPSERLDLDEFTYIEDGESKITGRYTRPCRCGEDEGYVVAEEVLDGFAEEGVWEVQVECAGCSLALVIEFGEGGKDGNEMEE